MLHQIHIPDCNKYLLQIVEFQKCIVSALCDAAITPKDVTLDWFEETVRCWIVSQIPDLPSEEINGYYQSHFQSRMLSFFSRKDKVKNSEAPFQENMAIVAGLTVTQKAQLLSIVQNIDSYVAYFTGTSSTHHLSEMLNFLESLGANQQLHLRGFFESFYNPNLYQGYDLPQTGEKPFRFNHKQLIEDYETKNPDVTVCCLCDGGLDAEEVDHFYPKSSIPFLSCHPHNLVPICSDCNGLKLSKPPFSRGETEPLEDWFHPYLRGVKHYSVTFERTRGGRIPKLYSADPKDQRRLENLEKLVGYQARWRKKIEQKFRVFLIHFSANVSEIINEQTDEENLTEEKLRDILVQELRKEAERSERECGLVAHSVLISAFLRKASEKEPFLFGEVWQKVLELDVVQQRLKGSQTQESVK